LQSLAPLLPANLAGEALALVSGFTSPEDRTAVLAALAPRMTVVERERLLQEARALPRAFERVRTLAVLARWLQPDEQDRLVEEARSLGVPLVLVEVAAALEPSLPPRQAQLVRQEALDVSRQITSSAERARALALLPFSPDLGREIPPVAAGVASLDDGIERRQNLARLLPHLRQLSRPALYATWTDVLPSLAVRPRRELLADLCVLRPVVEHLGGPAALAGACRAIQRVGEWWP
jgi:hypothetical protein